MGSHNKLETFLTKKYEITLERQNKQKSNLDFFPKQQSYWDGGSRLDNSKFAILVTIILH